MNATDNSDDDAPEERDDVADWEQDDGQAPSAGETLVVDVEGFEGPLDLLLALARTQKVDLARISVLALAQQYLCLLYTSPSPRDGLLSRMPSSA